MLQSNLQGLSLISFKNTTFCPQSTLPVFPTETVQEKLLSLKSNFQVTCSNIYLRIRHSDKTVLFSFLNSQFPTSFNSRDNVRKRRLCSASTWPVLPWKGNSLCPLYCWAICHE